MSVHIAYFVHATTTDNERGIATGWQPGELSATGQEQARTLAALTTGQTFDAVFSSDLRRAVESARLTFGDRHAIIQDARLRECDYGELTGHLASEFKHRLSDYIETPFPGGESYCDVGLRVEGFLGDLRETYNGASIAIVAHQAPQLALEVLLIGKSWQQAIEQDWRRTGSWQPGWHYKLD